MIDNADIIRQLTVNAEAIRALIERIPPEQARWKPDAETWSMQEVMAHLYNEERIDFRKHLKEMLNDPPLPWQVFDPSLLVEVKDLREALDGFLRERADSLAWLKALEAPNWDASLPAPWGTISAGDVLVSWPAHDYLHIRQINELLFAWNDHQAGQYSVRYAGEW
jgi:hypothetical protein